VSDLHALPRARGDAAGPDLSDDTRASAVDLADHDLERASDGESSSGQPDDESEFPRSHLFRTVQRHPVATAAVVAAVVFVGPKTIGRWGARGLEAANRHAAAMAPLVGQLMRVSGRR
jgi:hypothetical protein